MKIEMTPPEKLEREVLTGLDLDGLINAHRYLEDDDLTSLFVLNVFYRKDCGIANETYKFDESRFNSKQSDLLKTVFDDLKNSFGMEDWQFNVDTSNKVVSGLAAKSLPVDANAIIMPDVSKNESIITKVMSSHGYFKAKRAVIKRFEGDPDWLVLVFNPREQFPFNNYMFKHLDDPVLSCLCHATPRKNADGISKNGFCADWNSSIRIYRYENRIFFKYGKRNPKKFVEMMAQVSKARGDRTEFTMFEIAVTSELINEFKFFRDPNVAGCCYCASDCIPPEWITARYDFDLKLN